MKICVTATGPGLESAVNPHFGRCQYFVIVDPETMVSESFANEQGSASGGAGIQASQQIIQKGASVLITGSVGPNAFSLLSAENIDVKVFSSGSVLEAVKAYRDNLLDSAESANSPGKPAN